MLAVERLAKSYGSQRAVDGISFEVHPGEIYGLLGPNGAGKTTTISCVCGLLAPDAGRTTLHGIDVAADPIAFKQMIGVVPQENATYGDLTAGENARFWGGLAGLGGSRLRQRVREVLDLVGLADRPRDPVRKFSGGMKRRLNLAVGMVHEPQLLLLDEPTVGIDVHARLHILEVVRAVAKKGAAVLYTTHYLEEAQHLCDRIGIMDHGKILAEGTLDELKALVGEGEILTLRGTFSVDELREAVGQDERVRVVDIKDGSAMLDVGTSRGEVSEVLGRVMRRGKMRSAGCGIDSWRT